MVSNTQQQFKNETKHDNIVFKLLLELFNRVNDSNSKFFKNLFFFLQVTTLIIICMTSIYSVNFSH